MKRILFALILVLFIVGCKGNKITGGVVGIEQTTVLNSCEETDDGIDIAEKGYTSGLKDGKNFNVVDRCIGEFLVEYYCENNKISNQNFKCKCLSGECV